MLAARVLCAAFCGLLCGSAKARADDISAVTYVRTDTDHTVVVSPRARVGRALAESTQLDVTYAADVWTSASVDVRASASVQPVWEQRDELSLTLRQSWDTRQVRGGYRVSLEPDYTSHGINVGIAQDLANKAATVDVGLRLLADTVGRAGNPDFARSLATYTATASFTQILDTVMLAQLTYEFSRLQGYQSSPYRFVGFGANASGFGCRDADICLPELVPDVRSRHALSLMLRRALGSAVALSLSYRFYVDDWALTSHTVAAEAVFSLSEHTLLSARYRGYRQSSVDFYEKRYKTQNVQEDYAAYRTRDRELSSLSYSRASLDLEHRLWAQEKRVLSGSLSVSGTRYHYARFVGLNTVWALEATAALLLEF